MRRLAELGSYTAAIAHEVNNLLTPVVGLADLLEHSPDDPGLREQVLAQSISRCQRAVAICSLLVGIAKDGADDDGECDLAAAISAALSATEAQARTAGVILACGFSDPGRVRLPGVAAEHILLNLLLNAVQASPAGSTTEVTASYRPGSTWHAPTWTIRVIDSGRGLDPRDVAAINEGSSPRGSKGIGLMLSAALCKHWGGTLAVESTPGSGATFAVEWPAA